MTRRRRQPQCIGIARIVNFGGVVRKYNRGAHPASMYPLNIHKVQLLSASIRVGRPEPRRVVIATMGYLDEFWFSVVLGVSHRDDHFCQRNHGRISFGF